MGSKMLLSASAMQALIFSVVIYDMEERYLLSVWSTANSMWRVYIVAERFLMFVWKFWRVELTLIVLTFDDLPYGGTFSPIVFYIPVISVHSSKSQKRERRMR